MLAVLLNIWSFSLTVVGVIVLFVMMSLLHRHPTRACHRCGRRVRLDKRTCPHCGYEFAPISYNR
jgi:predicted amidophosphoribosyltransferase